MVSFRYLSLAIKLAFHWRLEADDIRRIAHEDLFYKSSFRQPNTQRSGFYLMLSGLIKLVSGFLKPREVIAIDRNVLVYDAWNDRWDPRNRVNFLQTLGFGSDAISILNRNSLAQSIHWVDRVLLLILASISAPFLWLQWTIGGYRKENLAFIQSVLVENAALQVLLASANVSQVYFFCAYEVDANLGYLAFHALDVQVTKVPSPNPLKFHYGAILTDRLLLSSAYQREEYNKELVEQFAVEDVQMWIPENAHLYLNHYLQQRTQVYASKLGFYSSGYWLRTLSGRSEVADWAETESAILRRSAELANSLGEPLTIYLHPREKLPGQQGRVNDHYANLLSGCHYKFFSRDLNEVTARSFDSTEVVVCPLSTAFFERLFCGFKTFLIKKPGMEEFPMLGSSINKVCLELDSTWEEKIAASIGIDEKDFFESFGLSKYYLNGIYPEVLKKAMVHVDI